MIHSIIGSSVVNKNYTSGLVLLEAIFDVLDQVEYLLVHDLCGRKPACSGIRCCSVIRPNLFRIRRSKSL